MPSLTAVSESHPLLEVGSGGGVGVGIVERTSAASLPSWTCEGFLASLSQKQPRVKWEDEHSQQQV